MSKRLNTSDTRDSISDKVRPEVTFCTTLTIGKIILPVRIEVGFQNVPESKIAPVYDIVQNLYFKNHEIT